MSVKIVLGTHDGKLSDKDDVAAIITEVASGRKKPGIPGDTRIESILRSLWVTDAEILAECVLRKEEIFEEGQGDLPKAVRLAKMKRDLQGLPSIQIQGSDELVKVLDAW